MRWYGDLSENLREPVLEIKSKLNLQGEKKLLPLPDCTWQELPEQVQAQLQIQFPDQSFQPSLVNTYERTYYRSMDGRFRLTVDSDMAFGLWQPWRFDAPVKDQTNLVLELKYEAENDSTADEIASHLPLRVSKHSKYARGIALAYDLAI
jgi:SPX domain protein involved in polyphosphate accumulation